MACAPSHSIAVAESIHRHLPRRIHSGAGAYGSLSTQEDARDVSPTWTGSRRRSVALGRSRRAVETCWLLRLRPLPLHERGKRQRLPLHGAFAPPRPAPPDCPVDPILAHLGPDDEPIPARQPLFLGMQQPLESDQLPE